MSQPARDSQRPAEIKVVGKSGQISLGKRYAGKTLQVVRQVDGTVLLTPVVVVPESQAWVFREPNWSKLQEGLAWAATHGAGETDLEGFLEHMLVAGAAVTKHENR